MSIKKIEFYHHLEHKRRNKYLYIIISKNRFIYSSREDQLAGGIVVEKNNEKSKARVGRCRAALPIFTILVLVIARSWQNLVYNELRVYKEMLLCSHLMCNG